MLDVSRPVEKGESLRKLFIAADIEGCAGVASEHALSPAGWEWPDARRWMTAEVVAAAEAALDKGYDEVIVADGHGNAQNILPDGLPARTRLVRGWPRPLLQMQGSEDPAVDACFFIGAHAGAADAGFLSHTYHGGAIRALRLNGEDASEGYFNAALAGEMGKPVLLVTGDAAAVEDARRYAPESELCAVKEAVGWRAQCSAKPEDACRSIREAADRALERAGGVAPFSVDCPITVELEMTTVLAAEMLAYLPLFARADARSVRAELQTVEEAMRVVSFAIMYDPSGRISL